MRMKTIMRFFSALVAAVGVAAVADARPVPGAALKARLQGGPDVIGIVHWGLNTYSDREWGYRNEDPAMLAPRGFDADQIIQACKAGGLGGLVVVAKHHDGFCLWPTKTTQYNISKSPFGGDRGRDYVREMEQACRRAGLKFGVYVSPWDRNSEHYGSEKYVELYHAQLKELLGGDYGEVFEMWFDGANGGDGWYGGAEGRRTIGKDYYRFGDVFAFVRELQPTATIFGGDRDDSDFRWPGNERGVLEDCSRATTVGVASPRFHAQMNTGSADGEFFRACEADFPLRRGWFYHERERGTTKSGLVLARLFVGNVGNGGTMNLGIAPNKDGVLDDEDVRALKDFKTIRDALFANEVREDDGEFNVVELREDLTYGERVDGWRLLAGCREILSGTAIGNRRIRILPKAERRGDLKLEITAGDCGAESVAVRCFAAPEKLAAAILGAATDFDETDTATWMTRPE